MGEEGGRLIREDNNAVNDYVHTVHGRHGVWRGRRRGGEGRNGGGREGGRKGGGREGGRQANVQQTPCCTE